jgi:2-polyprenyl-3-methyl-5-hydroxy-6-metoxy-1,4-benzoquinol methylase
VRTLDYADNNAWYRQMAAGWARRMITGDSPGAWAQNTDSEIRFAVQQLRLQPGDHILDLGCGWGRHSLPLAAYGLRVAGLDLSPELLTLARYNARRHGLSINWIEADIAHLPLRGSFDAVVQFCGNLMTWFPTCERTLDALWDVANLLRPGGRLLFGTEDWQPELPPRSQHWDEWQGGAAIYRQRYDQHQRLSTTQTVIFGPKHERHEYRRQTWWPSYHDMEALFARAGLTICGRYNGFIDQGFDPSQRGLVYVLAR